MPGSPPQRGGGDGDLAVVVTVLKAIMGAGGFALPWGFARMGIVAGAIAMGLCAAWSAYTVGELAALKAHVDEQRGNSDTTYVDVAHASLGRWGAGAVYVILVFNTVGASAAYLLFIATTLKSFWPWLHTRVTILFVAAAVLPTTRVTSFARLARGGVSAVLLGYSVSVASVFCGAGVPHHTPPASDLGTTVSGLGPVAFLFLSHFMLFPVMSSARASATGGFGRLAAVAMAVAAVVNATFAIAAVSLYGRGVASNVVKDIRVGTWWVISTKLLLCVDLFCTYALILASARQIVERSLWPESPDDGYTMLPQQQTMPGARRWMVTIMLALISILLTLLDDFGIIVSFVGGFAQVSLGFIFPPLMSLRLLRGSMTPVRLYTNLVLLPLGLATMVATTAGTFVSVLDKK